MGKLTRRFLDYLGSLLNDISLSSCLFLGLVFLLLGIIVEPHIHVAGIFISELGIAFIISMIIGISIEDRNKKEFSKLATAKIESFVNNSFQAIFGWDVPKIYIKMIQEQMTALDFYRDTLEIEFILKDIHDFPLVSKVPPEELNELLFLHSRFRYSVKNIRDIDSCYELVITTEKDIFPELNYVYSVYVETDLSSKFYQGDDLMACFNPEDVISETENCYRLPPMHVPPNTSLRAEIILHNPRYIKYNKESFKTHYFTEKFSVKFHSDIQTIDATCMSSSENTLGSSKDSYYCRWRNSKPLLPNQNITLWWRATEPIAAIAENTLPPR